MTNLTKQMTRRRTQHQLGINIGYRTPWMLLEFATRWIAATWRSWRYMTIVYGHVVAICFRSQQGFDPRPEQTDLIGRVAGGVDAGEKHA